MLIVERDDMTARGQELMGVPVDVKLRKKINDV
jgi:hypothetical protein